MHLFIIQKTRCRKNTKCASQFNRWSTMLHYCTFYQITRTNNTQWPVDVIMLKITDWHYSSASMVHFIEQRPLTHTCHTVYTERIINAITVIKETHWPYKKWEWKCVHNFLCGSILQVMAYMNWHWGWINKPYYDHNTLAIILYLSVCLNLYTMQQLCPLYKNNIWHDKWMMVACEWLNCSEVYTRHRFLCCDVAISILNASFSIALPSIERPCVCMCALCACVYYIVAYFVQDFTGQSLEQFCDILPSQSTGLKEQYATCRCQLV